VNYASKLLIFSNLLMLCVLYVMYDPNCSPVINISSANIYNDIQYLRSFGKTIITVDPTRNSSLFFKKGDTGASFTPPCYSRKESIQWETPTILSPFDGDSHHPVRGKPTAGVPPTAPPGECAPGKYPWVDHRRKR